MFSNVQRTGKYKSRFESILADQMTTAGIEPVYEETVIRFVRPEAKHQYKPDFTFPTFVIEAKGLFLAKDMEKHLIIKEQRPDLDVRFVFSNARSFIRGRQMTYADWCDKHGFAWAHKTIPSTWLEEALKELQNV
jgi:hypothetical protein